MRPQRVIQVKSKHRDAEMNVVKQFRGQTQQICICHQGCTLFKPGQPGNCETAESAFKLSQDVGIVLVHSCDQFTR